MLITQGLLGNIGGSGTPLSEEFVFYKYNE
jgi:hypothetical protein